MFFLYHESRLSPEDSILLLLMVSIELSLLNDDTGYDRGLILVMIVNNIGGGGYIVIIDEVAVEC